MNEKLQERALTDVMALHTELDAVVQTLVSLHSDRLQCRRGCSACCVDDLTVYEVEADRIRANCTEVLESAPHPAGACAFLDESGACRIYRDRPYVCRTQGLPLRWFGEDSEGETVELRDICSLNESETPIETLPEASCWLIGPTEGRLLEIQSSRIEGDEGPGERVALRNLFREAERK
jgi:hypothetical protein